MRNFRVFIEEEELMRLLDRYLRRYCEDIEIREMLLHWLIDDMSWRKDRDNFGNNMPLHAYIKHICEYHFEILYPDNEHFDYLVEYNFDSGLGTRLNNDEVTGGLYEAVWWIDDFENPTKLLVERRA